MYSVFNIVATVFISVICVALIIFDLAGRFSFIKIKTDGIKTGFLKPDTRKKISAFIEKFWFVFAAALGVAFIYSRFKELGVLPNGIHIDEIGMLIDARCLMEYGTDRYGTAWPVYLKNYGGAMGPVYAYLTSVVLRFFPMTFKYVRLSEAVMSAFGFIAMFGAGIELTGKKMGGVISAFIFTIFPSIMMMNRWDCDCHLLINFTAIALFLLLKGLNTEHLFWYAASSAAFAIGMYTYLVACIVFPVFLILLVGMMFYTKKLNVKNFCALFFPVTIVAMPLFIVQLVNMKLIPEFSFWGSDFAIFSPDRVGEITPAHIPGNIGTIISELINGDTLPYNAFSEFGGLYTFCIPLMLYGIYLSILKLIEFFKTKKLNLGAVIFVFAFVIYIMSLCHEWPNLNRYQELFIPISLFILMAIFGIAEHFYELSYITVGICAVGFVFFANFYFNRQLELYGDQYLFAQPDVYNAVFMVCNYVDPDMEKKVYVQLPYDREYLAENMIAAAGHVSPDEWVQYNEKKTENIGRFYMGFPEEFTDDNVYIMGRDWDHISNYLISIGFNCDETVPGMRILWK